MSPSPPGFHEDEYPTSCLDILDSLCAALWECRTVLGSVQASAGMNLDDLKRDLTRAEDGARQAFGAASLMSQRAALADSWSDYLPRPRAIYARHQAVVDVGAAAVTPETTVAQRLDRLVVESAASTRVTPALGRRCAFYDQRNSRGCRRRLAPLGLDEYADHCRFHLNAHEERRYLEFQAGQGGDRLSADDRGTRLGQAVITEWARRRHPPSAWVAVRLLAETQP